MILIDWQSGNLICENLIRENLIAVTEVYRGDL